ncbi:MAG: SprB repeat-containing protein [Christiangramia sp.]|uniref:SprB repeat-containing protein n=1 Tax=Christiangramia sp. TaxID=1931228 RepID=UPI003242302D
MIKYLTTLIVLLSFPIQAQNLKVNADSGNTSKLINDGYIKLKVSGGTPPYTYKWSDKNTSLESSSAYNLTEGTPYQVLITDSKGKVTLRSAICVVMPRYFLTALCY